MEQRSLISWKCKWKWKWKSLGDDISVFIRYRTPPLATSSGRNNTAHPRTELGKVR